jgi:hypothetical protein
MAVHKHTLKLFKALPVINKSACWSGDLNKLTIPKGFLLSPEVIYHYKHSLPELLALIGEIYGLSAKKMNETFHKSWAKVRDAKIEDLIVEQIAHYVTTYGKQNPLEYILEKEIQWDVEELGCKIFHLFDFDANKMYDEDYVYIPDEQLDVPLGNVKLVVIKGLTKDEIADRLEGLVQSGIALKEDTINDVIEVAKFTGIDAAKVNQIKNKEVKIRLYDEFNLVPTDPVEFLRYVVYKATGRSLLVKSPAVIAEIKASDADFQLLFDGYMRTNLHGEKRLAQIFYRFKPLFLAMRKNEGMRKYINRIPTRLLK